MRGVEGVGAGGRHVGGGSEITVYIGLDRVGRYKHI